MAARALWLETHPLPAISENMAVDDTTSVAAVSADQSNAGRNHATGKPGPNE